MFFRPKIFCDHGEGHLGRCYHDAREFNVFNYLMMNQTIFLGGPIDNFVADIVVSQLLFLEFQKPLYPIHLYLIPVNGEIPTTIAIYDTMQTIRALLSTICTIYVGQVHGMALLLLTA